MLMAQENCLFCSIVSGKTETAIVYLDDDCLVFLDHRPLFHGHCLVIPKTHYETLHDLPAKSVGPLFKKVKMISAAILKAMNAEGTFVAMNNRVSQSVPHLHVHVVPRKKGDGLKGFFWPRTKYKSPEEMFEVAKKIRACVEVLLSNDDLLSERT